MIQNPFDKPLPRGFVPITLTRTVVDDDGSVTVTPFTRCLHFTPGAIRALKDRLGFDLPEAERPEHDAITMMVAHLWAGLLYLGHGRGVAPLSERELSDMFEMSDAPELMQRVKLALGAATGKTDAEMEDLEKNAAPGADGTIASSSPAPSTPD